MTREDKERLQRGATALELVLELERNPTAATLLKIDEWSSRSKDNIAVFSQVAEAVNDLRHPAMPAGVVTSPAVNSAQQRRRKFGISPRVASRRTEPFNWMRLAAAFAVLFVMSAFAVWYWKQPIEYRTAAMPAEFTLADGSTAYLFPNSRLTVSMRSEERMGRLWGGSVSLTVKRDPDRPFLVLSGSARVEVLGTRFNVLLWRDNLTSVYLEEGQLRVSGKDESVFLSPGQFTQVANDGSVTPVTPVHIAGATHAGRVLHPFTDTTLQDIVDHFNALNNSPKLHVDDGPARRRFTAVVDLTNPQTLITGLERDAQLNIDDRGELVTITARQGTQ
jgi:ferric-dicitrate binding protein FerR (iron transport regulator)